VLPGTATQEQASKKEGSVDHHVNNTAGWAEQASKKEASCTWVAN